MTKVTMPIPAAHCKPDDPDSSSAFSWPGQLANPAHKAALFLSAQMEAYAAAKVREAQAWQPIETAPKDGTPLLLFAGLTRDGHAYSPTRVVGSFHYIGGWLAQHYNGPMPKLKPTHWMPLPPFPGQAENNESSSAGNPKTGRDLYYEHLTACGYADPTPWCELPDDEQAEWNIQAKGES